MKRIGLLSDTHGVLPKAVLTHFATCDEIWHAGDIGTLAVAGQLEKLKPFRAVHGNIDGHALRTRYPAALYFDCEGVTIYLTHIAGRPPVYNRHVQAALAQHKPQLLVCGHAHILRVERDSQHGGLLYVNPGAAGLYGIHKVQTLLRFTIANGKLKDMEAIEIGYR